MRNVHIYVLVYYRKKKHRFSSWSSIQFIPAISISLVFSARNLPAEKKTKKGERPSPSSTGRNTFVIIQYGKQKFRTATAPNTLQPLWNEECEFDIKEKHTTVKLSVAEKELLRDELIGSNRIDLEDLEEKSTTGKFWIPIKSRKHDGTSVPTGAELSVQLDVFHSPVTNVVSADDTTSIESLRRDSLLSIQNASPVKRRVSKAQLAALSTSSFSKKEHKRTQSELSQLASSSYSKSSSIQSEIDLSKSSMSIPLADDHGNVTQSSTLSPVKIRRRPSLTLPFHMTMEHYTKSSSFSSLNSIASLSSSTATFRETKCVPEVKRVSPQHFVLSGGTHRPDVVLLEIHGSYFGDNAKDLISILIGDVECISYMENWSNNRIVCMVPSDIFPKGEHDVIMTTKSGGVGLSLKKILVTDSNEPISDKQTSRGYSRTGPSTADTHKGEFTSDDESPNDIVNGRKPHHPISSQVRHDSNVYLRAEILRLQRLLEGKTRSFFPDSLPSTKAIGFFVFY